MADIDDCDATRGSLAASEQALRTFLSTVSQIVWTADATGWIDWYSDRWYDYTGQTPEEAHGGVAALRRKRRGAN